MNRTVTATLVQVFKAALQANTSTAATFDSLRFLVEFNAIDEATVQVVERALATQIAGEEKEAAALLLLARPHIYACLDRLSEQFKLHDRLQNTVAKAVAAGK